MSAAWFVCAAVALLGPWAALVWAQRRRGIAPLWYGLIVLGCAAAAAARVLQMGSWLIYHWIAPLPDKLPAEVLAARWDVLVLGAFALGPLVEVTKSYAVIFFDTKLNRGNQALYGFAVGAGAGWFQALWTLGAVGWTLGTGQRAVTGGDFALALRELCNVALESSFSALVMYFVARNQRWGAALGLGAVHGLLLLVGASLATRVEGAAAWASAALAVVGAGGALWALRWQVKTRGWPM